jgi:hypothetical protein
MYAFTRLQVVYKIIVKKMLRSFSNIRRGFRVPPDPDGRDLDCLREVSMWIR